MFVAASSGNAPVMLMMSTAGANSKTARQIWPACTSKLYRTRATSSSIQHKYKSRSIGTFTFTFISHSFLNLLSKMVRNASVAPELARNANYKPSGDNEDEEDLTNDDGDESTIETSSPSVSEEELLVDSQSNQKEVSTNKGTSFARLVANLLEGNPKATPQDMLSCTKILHTLIGNVIPAAGDAPLPFDDKKRRVRMRNLKIQQHIVSMEGAVEILEEAGFVRRVQDHDELLFFPDDADEGAADRMHQELTTLMDDLQTGRRATPKVSVRQRRKQERQKALLRWKDDNDKEEKDRLISNRLKLERRQEAERQQKFQQAQEKRDVFRPYVVPIVCAGMALAAFQDPSRIFSMALYAFVLYWMAIFFAHWASNESLGSFRRR